MTRTPPDSSTPLPYPDVGKLDEAPFGLKCNGCQAVIYIGPEDTYPPGWRAVFVPWYVGEFHACSDECEEKIKEFFNAER